MTTLRIPTPLRPYADGEGQIEIQADTVSGAMTEFNRNLPSLKETPVYRRRRAAGLCQPVSQ